MIYQFDIKYRNTRNRWTVKQVHCETMEQALEKHVPAYAKVNIIRDDTECFLFARWNPNDNERFTKTIGRIDRRAAVAA